MMAVDGSSDGSRLRGFAAGLLTALGQARGRDPLTPGTTAIPPQIVALAAQASGACVVSGVGLALRAGLSWATYAGVLARQLRAAAREPATARDHLRVLLDQTLTQLREIGELSLQEAQILQQDLQQLSAQLRDLDATEVPKPPRYARAKP